ncbi:hypothetical protein GCM10007116_08500 [Sulfodiicoccus acidiphilus]|uniref:Uncharacterized protein n=1 Tax=Sulfodiicoccus acidiphilus TaxID=1670455 RepID=A0A830H2X4_9CREN|nr:hypothetical protein [Sulfodiicoccus acidiphilus]GGT92971.1 hypothetical protein GCM10007116_08500 [Sulfodiicoccus acidiphilus]
MSCSFPGSVDKRKLLEQRMEELKALLGDLKGNTVCEALNYVCHHSGDYSLLEARGRRHHCFALSPTLRLLVVSEGSGDVVIVTFFPLSRERDFRNKCNFKFIQLPLSGHR